MADETKAGNRGTRRRVRSSQAEDIRPVHELDEAAGADAGEATRSTKKVTRAAESASRQTSQPLAGQLPAGAQGNFPVVGIGASAGGLAAFEEFFSALAPAGDADMAFILVQHLDPDHESWLTNLVRQYTEMQVYEAGDGMLVRPNSVYIIPPNKYLAIENGRLRLSSPVPPRGQRLPIDFFFRSLAQDQGQRSVCIILSGTATDGTLGLKAVREAGGLVVVQAPETAQYDGMPRSALATGLVDLVLRPSEMPQKLIAYFQHAMVKEASPVPATIERTGPPLKRIMAMLRSQTGHDFSLYKENTILRRIERRMAFLQLEQTEEYARFLGQHPIEVTTLFKELLIGVTNFFRDAEAFAALEARAIPQLFAERRTSDPVRVWVPACSTGEEAFSIAILLQEHIAARKLDTRVQLFATDIDLESIEHARAGVYPNSIAADVSPERLARFFLEENNTYRVKKVIRDAVVFAEQDVARDPPFSHVDLISCRNLLIYMGSDLQRKVLPVFYYALNPGGFLFLGTSETIGEFSDFFAPIDRKWKIYLRKPGVLAQRSIARFGFPVNALPLPGRRALRDTRSLEKVDVRSTVEQLLLDGHTPAAAVVTKDGEIVYIHGRTGHYLEPASGEVSMNILRMTRDDLRLQVATALRKANAQGQTVTYSGLRVRTNGTTFVLNLTVQPLTEAPLSGLYLIVFQEISELASSDSTPDVTLPASKKDQRITELERDLRAKDEYLQTTIEELETSNEELTSTNEELQSANEELQSTNEELETSREELQSVNEELMTVNIELQKKLEELSRVNNDQSNLLASTGIGTVFVDHRLTIQRFTPAATEIINLIQTDVGRPVSHLVNNLVGYDSLVHDVASVLETLIPKEAEVQTKKGRWFLMRIQPYRTVENVIEGAVITFVDINVQREMQNVLDEVMRLRSEPPSERSIDRTD